MCKFFDLNYYENVIGDGDIATEEDIEAMNLTQKMRALLYDEDLTPLQMRFCQCIEVGYIIPECYIGTESSAGCIICDPNDCVDFWPFFGQVLQEIHGKDQVSLEGEAQPVSHEQEWMMEKVTIVLTVTFGQEIEGPPATVESDMPQTSVAVFNKYDTNHDGFLDQAEVTAMRAAEVGLTAKNGAKSPKVEAAETDHLDLSRVNLEPLDMWLTVNRNIEGFTMCATMNLVERMACEDVVERAVQLLLGDPEWSGQYVSLTPGHPDEISLAEYKQFVEDGLMFAPATNDARMVVGGLAQDWPYGRGAYISADEMTTIWVGYNDHIMINARDPDTEFLDLLLERLRVSTNLIESNDAIEFRRHEKCGFINTMPANAGTGMEAVANVSCPNLTYDGTADIVKKVIREEGLDLEVRAVPERRWYASGDTHEVGDEGRGGRGMIQVALTRTYGVTEGWIVQKMYKSLSRLNELNIRYAEEARKWKAKDEKRKMKMDKLLKRFQEAEEDARDEADLAKQESGSKDLKIEFDIEIIDAMVLTEDNHRKKFGHEGHFEKEMPVLRTIAMFADSEEQYASWLVVLHWLADDCEGAAPVKDPRMCEGGIAPRRLSQDEWSTMQAVIGLIDLPVSSLRAFFSGLQKQGVLGMSDSHDREYLLYATFQRELYAYQTNVSDLMREEFKIDDLLQPCNGLNYRHVLTRLCLLNYGKVDCLPYAESMESNMHETEMVALRLIQTAVGEWIARRAYQKNPEAHPNSVLHTFWREHPTTYLVALRAARNTRLATLKLLMKLVRKTRPVAMTMEELEISRKTKGMLPMVEAPKAREMEVEFDGTDGLDSPNTLRETEMALEVLRDQEDSPRSSMASPAGGGIGGMGGRASEHALGMLMPMPAEEIENPIGMEGGLGGEAWGDEDHQEV